MKTLIVTALLAFPVLEGAILYQLMAGENGHPGWVMAWLLLAMAMGVALIKQARFSLLARVAGALASGQFSLAAFIDSFRQVIAGALLIFPGIISDVLAVLLLLVPLPNPLLGHGGSTLRRENPAGSGTTIEGEFRRDA